MKFVKLVKENIKLRKKANTFENKYNAANEELLKLYRNKSNNSDEKDYYKELATKFKEEIKILKKEKLNFISKLDEKEKLLETQLTKNEKLVRQIKKYNEVKQKSNIVKNKKKKEGK